MKASLVQIAVNSGYPATQYLYSSDLNIASLPWFSLITLVVGTKCLLIFGCEVGVRVIVVGLNQSGRHAADYASLIAPYKSGDLVSAGLEVVIANAF